VRWFTMLLGSKRKNSYGGYRTIVYLPSGEPVVVHDSLPFFESCVRPAREVGSTDISPSPLDSETYSLGSHCSAGQAWMEMNPASGLPMLPWGLDIGGSPYGLGDLSDPWSVANELDWGDD